jgi:hypothetical protein
MFITTWRRFLLKKLALKKFFASYETTSLLPCPKEPTTGCYSELDESSTHPHTLYFLNIYLNTKY